MLETGSIGLESGLGTKKINKGKVLGIAGSVISALAVALGIHFVTNDTAGEWLDMSLADPSLELESPFRPMANRPSLMFSGTDLIPLSRHERARLISGQLDLKRERVVSANYGTVAMETTLGELGLQFAGSLNGVLDRVEATISDLSNLSHSQLRVPAIFDVAFEIPEASIHQWGEQLAGYLNVAPTEPSLNRVRGNNFQVVPGMEGRVIDTEQFIQDAGNALRTFNTDAPIELISNVVQPRFDEAILTGVDSRIASFSSRFDPGIVYRATNVIIGTQIIDSHVIMPGETFNYNNVFPTITPYNGFREGIAFIDGRPTPTVGGGLCQVTSTLYGAVLRMGIIPTQSAPHSNRVHYVPGGLDACMWIQEGNPCNLIFTNPFDVPIYLSAYTNNGTMTVEFWSTADVLGDYSFEPVSAMIEQTATTETWNSWLRTYRNGNFVSEQFLRHDRYIR
ncbi:MAG: VanW family protein [Turicibacter sp.]|nr:VanW family protein [Turicibacter sp.]